MSQFSNCSGTVAVISRDIQSTTTGILPDWQKSFNDLTEVIDKQLYKFPKEPSKKKAKFKQSKFDQIKSFGKKNVNAR